MDFANCNKQKRLTEILNIQMINIPFNFDIICKLYL